MERVVKKYKLGDARAEADVRRYWLSRAPAERVAAVERLRREHHGSIPRLCRFVEKFQRARG
jgi:hypothetical protein